MKHDGVDNMEISWVNPLLLVYILDHNHKLVTMETYLDMSYPQNYPT